MRPSPGQRKNRARCLTAREPPRLRACRCADRRAPRWPCPADRAWSSFALRLSRERQKLRPSARVRLATEAMLRSSHNRLYGNDGDVAHVDAAADDPPALAHGGKGAWDQRADRREQNGRVERLGRLDRRAARPFGAHRARERLTGSVAGPGESEYAPSLPAADLGDDMRRGAEAIDADRRPVPGHFERAPADQAGAQQRRGRNRIKVFGQRKDERRLGDRMRCVAAVAGIAGE